MTLGFEGCSAAITNAGSTVNSSVSLKGSCFMVTFFKVQLLTTTSLRQGYGGQEERKERREKIVQSMNPILKILCILSKKLFVLSVCSVGKRN